MSRPPRIAANGRERLLDELEAETFDVLVIGGGITGAGVSREASLRGLRLALLEARDFASGTSSRSSKLIHGGLRYLAQGEVALVRETALERTRLHAIAPHLAEPCWMVVPARSRAGILKFRAGLGTYEKLGAVAPADRHRVWSGSELADNEPHLDRGRHPWACAYREYSTDDARLVLATLRSAVANGAVVAPKLAVESLICQAGRVVGVRAGCAESGRSVVVRGRCVVNAAGPWVEAVAQLEDAAAPQRLHLSKGVHVVLPASRLPVENLVILGASDRRSIFAIPRGDVVYLGTTDTSYGAHPDAEPSIAMADVEYLLEPLPRYFDVEPPRPQDCVSAWAGLRPLVAQPGKPATEISRRDEVTRGAAGMVTVAGGKLTGFRKMAISILETVGEVLGSVPDRPADDPPLMGGDFDGDLDRLSAKLASEASIPRDTADRMARLYGSEAASVLEGGASPLVDGAPLVTGEVDWAVEVEGAMCVEDVVYRRTRAAYYVPSAREAMLEPVAARMAELLGWSDERRGREVSAAALRLHADLDFGDAPGREPLGGES